MIDTHRPLGGESLLIGYHAIDWNGARQLEEWTFKMAEVIGSDREGNTLAITARGEQIIVPTGHVFRADSVGYEVSGSCDPDDAEWVFPELIAAHEESRHVTSPWGRPLLHSMWLPSSAAQQLLTAVPTF